jgi:restriction system protein
MGLSLALGLGIGMGQPPRPFTTETVDRAFDTSILVAAVVESVGTAFLGDRIRLIEPAWRAILSELEKDPELVFRFAARKWEEIVAAAYDAEGYNVGLTRRSGDAGVDVIATSIEGPRVKIFDQVKAFGRGHLVTANDVRALMGVVAYSDATKGVVTTTSEFAPRITQDPYIGNALSAGLELVNGTALRARLIGLGKLVK